MPTYATTTYEDCTSCCGGECYNGDPITITFSGMDTHCTACRGSVISVTSIPPSVNGSYVVDFQADTGSSCVWTEFITLSSPNYYVKGVIWDHGICAAPVIATPEDRVARVSVQIRKSDSVITFAEIRSNGVLGPPNFPAGRLFQYSDSTGSNGKTLGDTLTNTLPCSNAISFAENGTAVVSI